MFQGGKGQEAVSGQGSNTYTQINILVQDSNPAPVEWALNCVQRGKAKWQSLDHGLNNIHKSLSYLIQYSNPSPLFVACLQGGEGQWLSLDQELVMEEGEVVGTKVPTGHSLLLEAHFELPCGASFRAISPYLLFSSLSFSLWYIWNKNINNHTHTC